MVLTNTPETMGSPTGEYLLHTGEGEFPLSGTKAEIARAIWDAVTKRP